MPNPIIAKGNRERKKNCIASKHRMHRCTCKSMLTPVFRAPKSCFQSRLPGVRRGPVFRGPFSYNLFAAILLLSAMSSRILWLGPLVLLVALLLSSSSSSTRLIFGTLLQTLSMHASQLHQRSARDDVRVLFSERTDKCPQGRSRPQTARYCAPRFPFILLSPPFFVFCFHRPQQTQM